MSCKMQGDPAFPDHRLISPLLSTRRSPFILKNQLIKGRIVERLKHLIVRLPYCSVRVQTSRIFLLLKSIWITIMPSTTCSTLVDLLKLKRIECLWVLLHCLNRNEDLVNWSLILLIRSKQKKGKRINQLNSLSATDCLQVKCPDEIKAVGGRLNQLNGTTIYWSRECKNWSYLWGRRIEYWETRRTK